MKLSTRLVVVPVLLALAGGATGCADKARKESIQNSNLGIKARSDDEKLALFDKATSAWAGNNIAWWSKGVVFKDKERWKEAAEAFEKAAQISPKDPMYQMWLGISEYMRGVADATTALAKRENKKPEDVKPDLATINFESAKQHLQQAVKINPNMWRAHYYLGKILAATDKAREAADAFTHAIEANPREHGSYIALAELYRKWDMPDNAVKVATTGAGIMVDRDVRSDFWFSVGMANVDKMGVSKSASDKTAAKAAVDAFGKALEDNPRNHIATFQRAYAYFQLGEYKKSKEDLVAFQASKSAADGGMASKLLNDLAVVMN